MGNARFVRAFQALVGVRLRAVHAADPVPPVPPPLRYRHAQPAVLLRGPSLELRTELWARRFA